MAFPPPAPMVLLRQVGAVAAGALMAALGALVLGEYDLRGATVVVGFPLYGVAVIEVALAVGKRLLLSSLVAVVGSVVGGLVFALWISFGHFRNGYLPPVLSWGMVAVAAMATVAWCRSGRHQHPHGAEPPAAGDASS